VEEKIKKWQEEIKNLLEKQKEMNRKYNEKIKELQRKISAGKEQIRNEENVLIVKTVREIYGDVTVNSIEDFRSRMRKMKEDGWAEKEKFSGDVYGQ